MNLKSRFPQKLQKYVSYGVFPKLFLLPFAIATVVGMKLLSPLILIHVQKVHDWRIGHFATNTELTRLGDLVRNEQSRRKIVTIYFFGSKESSNEYLTTFWRRKLPSVSGHWGWLIDYFSTRITRNNSTKNSTDIDRLGLLQRHSSPYYFSEKEIQFGVNFVKSSSNDSKFVCLNVRDSEYLKQTRTRDMGYHDYRNSMISSYVRSSEALAELGYTVFRMGAIVNEPLVSKYTRVIDYATNGMRTEFLDIFLGAHCDFAVSVGSGWDSVPTIFRRPLMYVNHLPIISFGALTLPIMVYPKILVDAKSGEIQTLQELFDKNVAALVKTRDYLDAGIEIRDLSSEELVEAVTEMAQRFEGTFVETPEQKEMQAKLKHILSTHPKLQPSPNYYPIRAQFASCFLSRYPNFLDGFD